MAEDQPHIHPTSKFLYHLVLFFAYWFGAHRFDVNGDGQFKADDIQEFLADAGWVGKNFRKKASKKKKRRAAPQDSGAGVAPSRDGDYKVGSVSAEDEVVDNVFVRQSLPWFIILQCLLCLLLWAVFAIKDALDSGESFVYLQAGLDSAPWWRGKTLLRLTDDCEDLRFQAWRWITYQWTHLGAMHLAMNLFLCVMLGIPMEGLHGGLRLMFMYNVGVVGGALCYFVNDAHTVVVGCSGGCYSLLGMHVADLIMNWSSKRYRKPTMLVLAILIAADISSYAFSLPSVFVSHSAHVGGAIAGLIIGVIIGVNKKVESGERLLQAIFFCIGLVLVGGCVVWVVMHQVPINLWEVSRGELAHCWTRQIYNPSLSADSWLCVRCGNQSCIEDWEYMKAKPVSVSSCNEAGWYYGRMP